MTSQCVTLLGSAAVQMAVAWYAAVETSSGAWAAAMLVAGFVPQMAVSPFTGALIDRFGSRKTAIVVTDAASAAVAAALALFLATGPQGTAVLALLAVGSALRSVCAGVQMPAVQSAVPLLVPEASLTRYNGIASAVQSLAQFAAAPLAAFVLAFGDMAAVMSLDIATALVAIGVLAFAVKIPDAASAHTEDAPAAPGLFADVREGLRYARENRSVSLVLGSYGAFMFLSVPAGFFVPLLMERAFGAPYTLLAVAEAIGCVAMVAGGSVLAALASKAHNAMLPGGLIAYGAGSIGVGLATGCPVFFVSLAVLSAAIPLVQAAATARLQACVDPAMMGRVLDLGCGTGVQTFVLAKHIPGAITGIDLFPDFIDVFNARAEKLGLQGRVVGKQGSMDDLDIPFESVDLIWCEGAIDGVGFAKMIDYWKDFLKPGGYVGVTCPSWLTSDRIEEVDEFWVQAGSGLDTVACNVGALQDTGYISVATFALLKTCWTESYFMPRRAAESGLLKKYPDSKAVEEFIAGNHYEESLFSEHGDRYGYVFYIAKKI